MQQNQLNHCRNELRSCQARLILKNGKYFRFLAKPKPNPDPTLVQKMYKIIILKAFVSSQQIRMVIAPKQQRLKMISMLPLPTVSQQTIPLLL